MVEVVVCAAADEAHRTIRRSGSSAVRSILGMTLTFVWPQKNCVSRQRRAPPQPLRAPLCNIVCCAVSTGSQQLLLTGMCYCSAPLTMNARTAVSGAGGKGKAALTTLEARFVHAHLSRNRRELIRAILDNHEEAYFLSSRELAKRYNVDAATVVRAIQDLGYQRFADFAADLREHFVRQITPYTVLKAATRKRRSVADHVDGGLERDTENLRVLKSSLHTDQVVELAARMHRSRRILVVGVDLAASLAWFLAYGLTPLGFDAEAPVGSAGNLQHKIDMLTAKDLLVAISFGRCLRETVESVRRAHGRGVPTFGITDSDTT